FAFRRVRPEMRARIRVEKAIEYLLIGASLVAILTTVGIFLSVLFEALRFFRQVSPIDFLFGLEWSPQTAIREDQVGSSGAFGAIPLFVGTLLISGIAMLVAVPIGLMSAIYLSEYAKPRLRSWAKPLLELLAGIPTVVYGYFAAPWVGPWLRRIGARRRTRDGHHDHPVRLVAVRRRDQRRPAIAARRLLRARRDTVGNGSQRRAAGRAAGDRRRGAARGLPRDRRDHDRGHGRG